MTPLAWVLIALLVYVAGVIVTGRILYRRYVGSISPYRYPEAQDEAMAATWAPALCWPVFWPFLGLQVLWTWRNTPTPKDPT